MKKFLLSMLISFNVLAIDDFDLYKYGPNDKLDISRIGFVFKIVFYDTHEELQKAFNALPGNNNGEVRGFTMVSEFNDVCITHLVKPKIWDDREAMAIMGHEVYHCTLADHKDADPGPRVVSNDKEKTDEELYDEDRQLELEGLKEECENTKFEIVGCAELKET
ncbi:MAG: hypothetical protein NZ824_05425 [Candidatus Thioglobus sp.]|nr:hypothetical protein [Candidatus Thioglobus sp.]